MNICPNCSNSVEEIADNIWDTTGLKELYCPNCQILGECVIVAIDGVHISMILNVADNTIDRCEQIKDRCYILKAEDEDLRIIRYLNSLAREERTDFKELPRIQNNPNSYIIFLDTRPIGYLTYTYASWNGVLVPTIWQIYVVKDKRRMGYAGEMVKYLLDNEGDFDIDAPNDASKKLVSKFGWPSPNIKKIILG